MRYDQNTAVKGYRPVGKVVDLLEYRRWLAMDQAMVWEEHEQREEASDQMEPVYIQEVLEYAPVPRTPPHRRRSKHRRRQALLLDLWASAAVVVMALTFTVRVLFF